MVSAVVAAFLYLRVVVAMYFPEDPAAELMESRIKVPVGASIALVIAVVGTLWLGIVPGAVTNVANDAVAQLVAFKS